MKTWYSSHCCRHYCAVLFLLVTLAVCSWTQQTCDSSSPSGGSLLRLPRKEGRSSDRQEFRVLSGVFQGCLSPSQEANTKKKVCPAKSHCGFPEQFPLVQKSLSHLPQEQKSCKSSCSIPWLPAAPSSLALTNTESGEAKQVQEQLHKAAEVLKML